MIALFPVIVALVVPVNEPIIRRDDRPDSSYCKLGAKARAVVSICRAGDGTLIASRWVLTAGHVARSVSTREPAKRLVAIGGVNYAVAATFVHPEWTEMGPHDVGLLRLVRAVTGETPTPLYRDSDERGRISRAHQDRVTAADLHWSRSPARLTSPA